MTSKDQADLIHASIWRAMRYPGVQSLIILPRSDLDWCGYMYHTELEPMKSALTKLTKRDVVFTNGSSISWFAVENANSTRGRMVDHIYNLTSDDLPQYVLECLKPVC